MIDIKGLDKVELLRQLWNAQKVASFFEDVPTHLAPKFNEELAKRMVKSDIDYFCGRCIKSDISGDVADSYEYDKEAGAGKFKEIVARMRKFEMPKEYVSPHPPREYTNEEWSIILGTSWEDIWGKYMYKEK